MTEKRQLSYSSGTKTVKSQGKTEKLNKLLEYPYGQHRWTTKGLQLTLKKKVQKIKCNK